MSSQITVVHGIRQIRVKYTPSTLLREIKERACDHLSLDADSFALRSKKSLLNESLPFRLSNLIPNTRIELVAAPKSNGTGIVQIKVSFPEYSGIGKFPATTTIWNVLNYFEAESGLNITSRKVEKGSVCVYEMPQIQLFNTIITKLEELDQPLEKIGLTGGNALMRVRFEAGALAFDKALEMQKSFATQPELSPPPQPQNQQPPQQTPTSTTISKETEPDAKKPDMEEVHPSTVVASDQTQTGANRQPQAYLPSDTTRSIPDDSANLEMTPAQFRKYRSQLSSQSGSDKKDSPLMTTAMREQQRSQKLPKISQCVVRVRLPDQTQVEGSFKPSESVEDLYRFVKGVLRNPELPFLLFMFPPRRVLGDPNEILHEDCNFGSRELIYFEWDGEDSGKFPKSNILNDSALSTAKPITEDEAIKLDEAQPAENSDSVAQNGPQHSNKTSTQKSASSTGKPKWFKLGRR